MYVVMMTKEGSTKIVNFMTCGVEFLLLYMSYSDVALLVHLEKIFFSTAEH